MITKITTLSSFWAKSANWWNSAKELCRLIFFCDLHDLRYPIHNMYVSIRYTR